MSLLVRLMVAVLFFFSGVAALTYQVAWQRLLVVFAGGDVLSITIIVTAFMTGLGLGSLAGGVLADKMSPRQNLMLFGVAEALISLFGLGSKALFYDVLYLRLGGIAESRALTAMVLVAVLLLPTMLMGMSLPLLARALIRQLPDAAVKTGRLYGLNTLGAACGAFCATWLLLPRGGIEHGIHAASVMNAFCALGIAPLLFSRAEKRTPPVEAAPVHLETFCSLRQCLVMAALSGFIALALEMVWFRLLGVTVKSTAFTFGTFLSVYLLCAGLGALAGAILVPRVRRPLSCFLIVQSFICISAGLVIAITVMLLPQAPEPWRSYFDSYEPIDANTAMLLLQQWWRGDLPSAQAVNAWIFPVLHLGLPLLWIGPPAFLMGAGYPLLQKAAHSDIAHAGRRVGWIQGANIGGNMLGAALVSTLLLPLLGTASTLRLLVALGAVFAVMLLLIPGTMRRHLLKVALLVIFGVVVFMLPDQQTLWARLHGTTNDRMLVREDGAGLAALKKTPEQTMVFVNGIGQSWIPFGGVHSVLGALPVLMHPKPENIAVIGLGSGDTLFSAASRAETKEIVCIEIVGAALDNLRAHAAESTYEALHALLADERIRHIHGDGRQFLMTTDQQFDLIEADALRPSSAHSGNLYSEEYFHLLRRKLKPGGYAVTWEPTPRVRETFVRVFSHVLAFPHLLIGSSEPLALDREAVQRRLADLDVRYHYTKAGIDIRALLEPYLRETTPVLRFDTSFDRAALRDINTDLFPKDEFDLPALRETRQ
ncbi:MAG: fused MFS/spermidine synthase [Verrucomicrobiaceae bacterium]|nr:fused MFS/spermidine synthase [Verrucomicrobiaceae bacterium]